MESIANNISSYNIIANFIPGMISISREKGFKNNNMYRSFATIFLIAICICFYKNISSMNMLPFLLGFPLFLYSYIKQQKYINSLIKFSKEE